MVRWRGAPLRTLRSVRRHHDLFHLKCWRQCAGTVSPPRLYFSAPIWTCFGTIQTLFNKQCKVELKCTNDDRPKCFIVNYLNTCASFFWFTRRSCKPSMQSVQWVLFYSGKQIRFDWTSFGAVPTRVKKQFKIELICTCDERTPASKCNMLVVQQICSSTAIVLYDFSSYLRRANSWAGLIHFPGKRARIMLKYQLLCISFYRSSNIL
jgi:hypothetical protein